MIPDFFFSRATSKNQNSFLDSLGDLLLVSLYSRLAFRVCIFLLFVILSRPHFAMSQFLIIINLFCFMSVLA